ncbi:hypothetical protein H5410_035584 [Solanum commersonii]|uniref:Uncharacterized protein n=1 Tax=Solanum commersonii TaxID=4109 RepID=A0A9J5Y456_SOLCO|nr:hypothetical protein H5410_035584 [Solanum commersonii]
MIFLRKLTYEREKNLGRYSDIIQVRMFITSKMIIKHIIHIEDWGISSMTERQFSLNKVMSLPRYFIILYQIGFKPVSESYHANNKNIAEPFHKLYKEWVKNSRSMDS